MEKFELYNIYGDKMVVQRRKPIVFAGKAEAGLTINGYFAGTLSTTVVGSDGVWKLEFPAIEAGGPYDFRARASSGEEITLSDILVGEVWFCSGQSNMEFPIWGDNPFIRLPEGEAVAEAANDAEIRLMAVSSTVSPGTERCETINSGEWRYADSFDNVADFSAVAYFFAQELRRRLGVPVGLINSSWGGTRIEPWIPEFAFKEAGRTKELEAIARAVENKDRKIPADKAVFGEEYRSWIEEKFMATAPEVSAEASASWMKPDADEGWTDCGYNRSPILCRPGIVWFRTFFDLPEDAVGKKVKVFAAHVEDADEAWLDGEKIGETTPYEYSFWSKPRNYEAVVKNVGGKRHCLTFRVIDHYEMGALQGIINVTLEDGTIIKLGRADWQYRIEFYADIEKIGMRPNPKMPECFSALSETVPATLFNAMVLPFTVMNIGGVIWYQGCSNASESVDYAVFQKLQLDSWRKVWGDDKLPFIVTQLAGWACGAPNNRLPDDFWMAQKPDDNRTFVDIRAVQEEMLHYHDTGLATAIDLGDHSNIHPANKKDVAIRLANEAMRLAYGEKKFPPARAEGICVMGSDGIILVDNVPERLFVPDGDKVGEHLIYLTDKSGEKRWTSGRIEDGKLIIEGITKDTVSVSYGTVGYAPGPFVYRVSDKTPLLPFTIEV